jgi:hypothetical protein
MQYFKLLMKAIKGDLTPDHVAKQLEMSMSDFHEAVRRHCIAKKMQVPGWVPAEVKAKPVETKAKPATAGLINVRGQNVIAGTPRAYMAGRIQVDFDEVKAAARAEVARLRDQKAKAGQVQKAEAYLAALNESDRLAALKAAEFEQKKADALRARQQYELKKAATVAICKAIRLAGLSLQRREIEREERMARARHTDRVQAKWPENLKKLVNQSEQETFKRLVQAVVRQMLSTEDNRPSIVPRLTEASGQNSELANQLINFLSSPEGKKLINK